MTAPSNHRRARRARNPLPRIVVNGPRPGQAVFVTYPSGPEQLAALTIQSSDVMRPPQYEQYRERTEWLANVAALCGGLHPEDAFEYTSFLTREEQPRVTIAVMTTPPIVVFECPFVVSNEQPTVEAPKKPIYGPGGQQIN
jgi:hypothetical protein